jgi:hypothetical protein
VPVLRISQAAAQEQVTRTQMNLEKNMTNEELQKAIAFATTVLSETTGTDYAYNLFKTHLTALVLEQERRAKSK